MTYESVLNLLATKELPFLDTPELKAFAVEGIKDMLARHDSTWITENRVRLIEELEQISEM